MKGTIQDATTMDEVAALAKVGGVKVVGMPKGFADKCPIGDAPREEQVARIMMEEERIPDGAMLFDTNTDAWYVYLIGEGGWTLISAAGEIEDEDVDNSQ